MLRLRNVPAKVLCAGCLLLGACVTVIQGPSGPTPEQLAAYRLECVTLWADEHLHQPPDDAWIAGCVDARAHGATPGDILVLLRATPEWHARHDPPPPHPTTGESGALSLQGADFVTADGRVWAARGVTAFLLFDRYQRGEDITPQLAWYVAHERNLVRVFVGGVNWSAPWCQICTAGTKHPDLAQLPAFFDLLADWGLRVEASVVTHGDFTFDEWRRVLQAVINAASQRWNVFLEVVNEPWNGWAAGLDPQALLRGMDRQGVPMSYGYAPLVAPDGESYMPSPHLDYMTWHSPRDAPHFPHNSKDAWGIRNANHVPVWDDEPLGYADFDRAGGGSRTTNLEAVVSHFAVCALFAGGCTWHLESGVFGGVPADGTHEEEISRALQKVAAFFPPEAHTGVYNRAGLGDFGLRYQAGDSLVNHAYGMTVGQTQWAVVPLPRPGWMPIPINGWRLGEVGPVPGVVSLRR